MKHALWSAAALVSLSACVTPPETPDGRATPTAADRHAITVTQADDHIEMSITEAGLDASEMARLDEFGRAFVRTGHGQLMLNAPRSGGEGALRAAADARLRLMDMGVPYDAIAIAAYEGGAETAPLVLSFTRYEATAPRCAPIWEQDLMRQYDNQPYESFGCANAANLAAMIEDPHDLVAARDETARDSARRAAVVDRYRRGQPTGATRSGDERVTISNAVN